MPEPTRPLLRESSGPRDHVERSRYTILNVTCAGCGEPWEQPLIDPDDIGWIVCPHCNHAARCHKPGRS